MTVPWMTSTLAYEVAKKHFKSELVLPDAAMLELPEIMWSSLIPAGKHQIPNNSYLSPHRDGKADLYIEFDYQIALYPIFNAHFIAFLDATGCQTFSFRRSNVQMDHPAVRIYCTSAVFFCNWLTQICRATELIDDSWIIDLPTEDEWLIGYTNTIPSTKNFAPPNSGYQEFVWQKYPYHFAETLLEEQIISSVDIANQLSRCLYFQKQGTNRCFIMPLSPTWDNNIGFRVVCRMIIP